MNENKHCIKSKNRKKVTDIQEPILEKKSNSHGPGCKQATWSQKWNVLTNANKEPKVWNYSDYMSYFQKNIC